MIRTFLVLCLLTSFGLASGAKADYLVSNAKVGSVSNTSGNGEVFVLTFAGGAGVCAKQLVFFQEDLAGSAKIFSRAFAVALTAFATGQTVDVFSYWGDDCSTASYIQIK